MFIRSAGFAGTILLAAGLAQAAVIHVSLQGDDSAAGDSWATAKRTIQAAVDVAGYADTVLISNGIHVLTNTIRIEHDVGELRSLDGRNVIIDGNHQVPCLAANKRVNLHGLTFRNGKGTGPTETGGQVPKVV